jgi:hypothetical protein
VLAKRLQQRDSWPALHNAQSGRKHIANIFTKLGVHIDTAAHHRRVFAVLTYLRSQRA